MRIKTGIIIVLNGLIILVVVVLSFAFYEQFVKALNERILLQLTSIKRLKRVQIEEYLRHEWEAFSQSNREITNHVVFSIPEYILNRPGIHDLTRFNPDSLLLVGMIDAQKRIKLISHQRFQEILLERTGMGNTGESYLVGPDFRLRSISRFFPEKHPYEIEVKTYGVKQGLIGENGQGIFPDYRGIEVYSAYHQINIDHLNWVILSEIDVKEAAIPLEEIQRNLFIIALIIICLVVLFSLYLSKRLSSPLISMKDYLESMARGNYSQPIDVFVQPKEMNEMYSALIELQNALSGAVDFSLEIGKMNLKKDYQPKSTKDLLGHSLISMRDKLLEYQQKEDQNTIITKRLLVERLEKERKRLARDLHDGVGPLLTSVKLYAQTHILDETQRSEVNKLLDETLSEIRRQTYELMPPSLHDFGIGLTLQNLSSNIQKISGLDIVFEDLTKSESSTIPSSIAINLFRICQELFHNTIRHANASMIRVSLSELDDRVSLYYMDNGVGFVPSEIQSGSGLTNIQERVDIFRGFLHIQSERANTVFEIELPLSHGQ